MACSINYYILVILAACIVFRSIVFSNHMLLIKSTKVVGGGPSHYPKRFDPYRALESVALPSPKTYEEVFLGSKVLKLAYVRFSKLLSILHI